MACDDLETSGLFWIFFLISLTLSQAILYLYVQLTLFISHRPWRWELRRFYLYSWSMFHWTKPDQCRLLMNGVINQRPLAELWVWGRPLEGAGATLRWWSLILGNLDGQRKVIIPQLFIFYCEHPLQGNHSNGGRGIQNNGSFTIACVPDDDGQWQSRHRPERFV